MQDILFNYPNLDVRAGSVFDLLLDDADARVAGVKLGTIGVVLLFHRAY